jgi:hypothetical protein
MEFWVLPQGAKSGGDMESAQAKNKALECAGAIVPTSFEGFEAIIKATYESLVIMSISSGSHLILFTARTLFTNALCCTVKSSSLLCFSSSWFFSVYLKKSLFDLKERFFIFSWFS